MPPIENFDEVLAHEEIVGTIVVQYNMDRKIFTTCKVEQEADDNLSVCVLNPEFV